MSVLRDDLIEIIARTKLSLLHGGGSWEPEKEDMDWGRVILNEIVDHLWVKAPYLIDVEGLLTAMGRRRKGKHEAA